VIPVGLAMLALEFAWAERMLDHALRQADVAKRKAAETTRRQRILSGLAAGLGIAAFVTAAILWDLPLLPV
jgi:Putative transmembrane protein (PGPGW)